MTRRTSARIERRGQQIARPAAQDGARFGDAQLLGGNKGRNIGAPRDPLEQRRAADPPGLVPAKQQDGAAAIAFGIQPIVGAGKATDDAVAASPPDARKQDARSVGSGRIRWIWPAASVTRSCCRCRAPAASADGSATAPFRTDLKCTGARDAIAPQDCVGDDAQCSYVRPLPVSPYGSPRCPLPPSQRKGRRATARRDILNGTTIAIASQELCGFRVDEQAIRALIAAKLPDLSPDLIALQLRGYARVLPRLDEEQRKRHCAETRSLAKAAGWLR